MEDLIRDFDFEEVSHFLIWDHMPSPEEKHSFRSELGLASRNIPQPVVDVIGSLPYAILKFRTSRTEP